VVGNGVPLSVYGVDGVQPVGAVVRLVIRCRDRSVSAVLGGGGMEGAMNDFYWLVAIAVGIAAWLGARAAKDYHDR
jgi:hypothetical protein